MNDDWLIDQARKALQRQLERPAREWFEEMERLGVIDKQGRVLLRVPLPPGQSYEDEPADGATSPDARNGSAGPASEPGPDGVQ
jgi:hypothetical protein